MDRDLSTPTGKVPKDITSLCLPKRWTPKTQNRADLICHHSSLTSTFWAQTLRGKNHQKSSKIWQTLCNLRKNQWLMLPWPWARFCRMDKSRVKARNRFLGGYQFEESCWICCFCGAQWQSGKQQLQFFLCGGSTRSLVCLSQSWWSLKRLPCASCNLLVMWQRIQRNLCFAGNSARQASVITSKQGLMETEKLTGRAASWECPAHLSPAPYRFTSPMTTALASFAKSSGCRKSRLTTFGSASCGDLEVWNELANAASVWITILAKPKVFSGPHGLPTMAKKIEDLEDELWDLLRWSCL